MVNIIKEGWMCATTSFASVPRNHRSFNVCLHGKLTHTWGGIVDGGWRRRNTNTLHRILQRIKIATVFRLALPFDGCSWDSGRWTLMSPILQNCQNCKTLYKTLNAQKFIHSASLVQVTFEWHQKFERKWNPFPVHTHISLSFFAPTRRTTFRILPISQMVHSTGLMSDILQNKWWKTISPTCSLFRTFTCWRSRKCERTRRGRVRVGINRYNFLSPPGPSVPLGTAVGSRES